MSVAIRINQEIYEEAKKVAKAECRSIPGQVEFWARIGKCALDNPDLPIEFIKELLLAKYQDRSLAEPFSFENDHEKR
ncbi:MAG: ParD-like family protein [Gammaproteobacteria bacterium]